MALGDILKKKETKEDEIKKPKEEVILPKASLRTGKSLRSNYQILKAPQITEKATELTKNNQYVFKVFSKANKIEIKRAVEDIYRVDVLEVKVINIPPKKRRLGRMKGLKQGYKKAVVRIKEGQKIETFPR